MHLSCCDVRDWVPSHDTAKKGADSWAGPHCSVLVSVKTNFLFPCHSPQGCPASSFYRGEQLPLPDLVSFVGWGPCGLTHRGCWCLDGVLMKKPSLKSSRLTSGPRPCSPTCPTEGGSHSQWATESQLPASCVIESGPTSLLLPALPHRPVL